MAIIIDQKLKSAHRWIGDVYEGEPGKGGKDLAHYNTNSICYAVTTPGVVAVASAEGDKVTTVVGKPGELLRPCADFLIDIAQRASEASSIQAERGED